MASGSGGIVSILCLLIKIQSSRDAYLLRALLLVAGGFDGFRSCEIASGFTLFRTPYYAVGAHWTKPQFREL